MAKTDRLKEIVAKKKERIVLAKQQLSEEDLKEKLTGLPPTRPFKEAISKPRQISLIAEIKQSSPSGGVIRQDFNLAEVARAYQEAGAQAVSVLTEEDFFGGKAAYLNEVKGIFKGPVLRKDFILESYQVYESRYLGADAILLIADLLTKEKLAELMRIADSLSLDYLVEVHDEKELKKVLSLKVPIIGINNRNLRTLEVDFKVTEKLFTLVPKDKIIVVESGIKTHNDIKAFQSLGVHAVLIGETFMREKDIGKKIKEMMG